LTRPTSDLAHTARRRPLHPAGDEAGMELLDRMVRQGFPMPAIFYSGSPDVRTAAHPRAAAATDSPEDLVNEVVDVLERRPRGGGGSLLRRK
jgi:hypothetical protein